MRKNSPSRKEMFLFYYKRANIFTDCDGHIVYDMFRFISPNDLYMFRHNNKHNVFRHQSQENAICRVLTVFDDEDYYWDEQDLYDQINRDYYQRLKGE